MCTSTKKLLLNYLTSEKEIFISRCYHDLNRLMKYLDGKILCNCFSYDIYSHIM